ncbi:MAG: electron transfer flavoprotein subunit alpha/FixB family protein [Propionicimonas sp.]
MNDSWIFVTEAKQWGGMLAAARRLGGRVTAVVAGPPELAATVAASGPDEVRLVEPAFGVPVEAYAGGLAEQVARAAPSVVISSADPAARVLLGAAAARLGAALVPGMVELAARGDQIIVHRSAISGDVIETIAVDGPLATIFTGEDAATEAGAVAPITPVDLEAADLVGVRSEPTGSASGLTDAQRVVSFGRGVRARADVALIQQLADALGAEVACSMPVADDLGWLAKERYVGRSGQHIAPRLYLAVGIAGAPQHLEGVRDAKVVAAINIDPEARIFRTADYGVVGDLYEVVPALIEALTN